MIPADKAFDQLNVMVVDDNAAMRGILRALLTAFGCRRIVEAANGLKALELLRETPIDVMICDWKMSPIDGLELVRNIRDPHNSPAPFLPIIMITAYSERSKINIARDSGVTEFLVKPVTSEALFKRLQVIVNRPRPFVRTKMFFGPDRRRRPDDDYEGPERRSDAVSI
ncbi:response regulator [Woodsholea maritima]|uniref:response regulator n=1 Tax=Woodsholea maritima TaxID=240237 RepID=UPI000477FA1F|nr:response regulator [Woodsholea maritima]